MTARLKIKYKLFCVKKVGTTNRFVMFLCCLFRTVLWPSVGILPRFSLTVHSGCYHFDDSYPKGFACIDGFSVSEEGYGTFTKIYYKRVWRYPSIPKSV